MYMFFLNIISFILCLFVFSRFFLVGYLFIYGSSFSLFLSPPFFLYLSWCAINVNFHVNIMSITLEYTQASHLRCVCMYVSCICTCTCRVHIFDIHVHV